ncbi:MAG: HdeD family acid-resistance protein, partial [Sandaracinobacteroides sp.]
LLFVFAVFAAVDGALGLASAFGQARRGERWAWLAVEGVATLMLAVLALMMPGLALTVIYLFIAIKALISGVFLVAASVKLDSEHGQGWLLAAGLVSLAFGVLLLLAPMIGGKILIWWIGIWAMIFGLFLALLGFRLRTAARRLKG